MSSQEHPHTPTNPLTRYWRFLRRPWQEKAKAFFSRWMKVFPRIPIPVRLPFGAWWLAGNDFVGAAIFSGGFENTERSFVERYLRPGMIVLDIGAHHGYYTLLASRKVGAQGMVLSVEASPRERKKLRLHLRINRCKNVQVEDRALGETPGIAEMYLVQGIETGCNSLQKPEGSQPTDLVSVRVERLDLVLAEHRIERVDFVKLDVEGAELSVLRGSTELLRSRPRPVILAEVQNIRTRPWGYPAREIIRLLAESRYHWFQPLPDDKLQKIDTGREEYDGNFVAVPEERLDSLSNMFK